MVFVRDFQNIKAPAVAEKALTFWLTIFSFSISYLLGGWSQGRSQDFF